MELVPILSQVSSNAMENTRESIHLKNELDKAADHVRVAVELFFNSQEHSFEKNL